MRALLRIASLVTLSACPGPVVVDAGVEPDAGHDAGVVPDAGPLDCRAPGTSPDAGCGTLSWAESSTMVRPRNHHSSALVEVDAGAFLYVVGGGSGNSLQGFVDRAKLNDDGSIGAFEQLPQQLPMGLGGATGALLHRVLVISGGTTIFAVSDKSHFAQVKDDGSLSAFFPAGSIGHPRMHPASVVRGDFVYVLGGFRDPEVWDDVVKAQWYPNETLGPWNPGGTLPGRRTHMAATRVGDVVYLTGGLDQSPYGGPPSLKTVSRGSFDANGDLGSWASMPELPVALATHASAHWGGWLYVMGGISQSATGTSDQEKRVWRAAIGDDFGLSAWEGVAGLPVARGHVHDLPIFKNHLYSIAGAVDFSLGSTGAIQIGTFQ